MPKLDQRGVIAQVFLLLVLGIGLVAGVYLVQQTQIFRPKAASAPPAIPESSFELELEKNPDSVSMGSKFGVDIYARSDIDSSNLFAAKLKFPTDLLEVSDINLRDTQTFVKNWVEKTYDNLTGEISIVGGAPNPGIKTDSKAKAYLMASVIFNAKKEGVAKVTFNNAAAIYRNSDNVNIISAKRGIDIKIVPATKNGAAPSTINTLDYFLSKHPGKGLTGTHPFSQTVEGQTSYYVKWDPNIFEVHKWDDSYIYLNEDHSGAPVNFYSFKPGIWMKRNMQIGEKITENDNKIEWFNPSCRSVGKQSFPIEITLEKRIPDYDLGGDLGKQDVIIVKYDSSLSNPKGIYERFYYSKEWGWVKWEEYSKTDDLKPTNTSIFNKISSEEPLKPNKAAACVSEVHISTSTSTSLPDKGDGNNDGKIDLVDLSILLTDFNKTNGLRKGIDMNGDGVINTFDFSLIRTLLIQKGLIKG